MQTKIYAIRDNKLDIYGMPFTAQNDILASRALFASCNDRNLQLGLFPSNFDLYSIGTYDDAHGDITPNNPVFIVSAISCIETFSKQTYDGSKAEKTEKSNA